MTSRSWRSPVLHRDDDRSIFLVEVDVHEDHRPPRPEQEPVARPPSVELGTEARESGERCQRASDPFPRIGGKAVRGDESFEILDGGRAHLDRGHGLEVIERDGPARPGIVDPFSRSLERTRDAIEEFH